MICFLETGVCTWEIDCSFWSETSKIIIILSVNLRVHISDWNIFTIYWLFAEQRYGYHCDWGMPCDNPIGFEVDLSHFWRFLYPMANLEQSSRYFTTILFSIFYVLFAVFLFFETMNKSRDISLHWRIQEVRPPPTPPDPIFVNFPCSFY